MTVHLLDINVLIALIDREHLFSDLAHDWFAANAHAGWATCPITENGVMRIMGRPTYPMSPGNPAVIAGYLAGMGGREHHRFWPDDVSLLDPSTVKIDRLLTAGQLTDTYLLALARAHDGKLATFDRRLAVAAVTNGSRFLHVIQ